MKYMRILILIVIACAGAAQAQECDKANELTAQAYDLGFDAPVRARHKQLLREALRLCPGHAEAHNNLGYLFELEHDYEQALQHYQAATQSRPDFAAAWLGAGDAQAALGQFPLALEAYLHGCQDADARMRIEELLRTQRFRISEEGELLNKESLLLLFDPQRRARIREMLKSCGFKASVAPEFIFRNILFDTGKAALKPQSLKQLEEIGAALAQITPQEIIISGHTDKQGFKGVTDPAENARRNMQLSEDRADSVAQALARSGVPPAQINAAGYGQTRPLAAGDTEAAYAQNRRVTIEVR